MICRAVYQVSPELVDWLSNNFSCFEESSFIHLQGIQCLTRIADEAEAGRIPTMAATYAIRNYNEEHGTELTYDEVRSRSTTHVFSGVGDACIYSEDCATLLKQDLSPGLEAILEEAPPEVRFIAVWMTSDDLVFIYRSPYEDHRVPFEDGFADGHTRGDALSYVLPPDIEAAMFTTGTEIIDRFAEREVQCRQT